MRQFEKRPVKVKAYQTDIGFVINNKRGKLTASAGDWIINDEYPCKPDVFAKTYREVDGGYEKLPVTVQAYRTKRDMPIATLEGVLEAKAGDWIITGVNGEKYPCSNEKFKELYSEKR